MINPVPSATSESSKTDEGCVIEEGCEDAREETSEDDVVVEEMERAGVDATVEPLASFLDFSSASARAAR